MFDGLVRYVIAAAPRPRSPWCREARPGGPGAVSEAIDRERRRLGQNKRREERLRQLRRGCRSPGAAGRWSAPCSVTTVESRPAA